MTAQSQSFWQAFTPKLIVVWREGQIGRLWRGDALAGLTVAIVALPLAMGLGIGGSRVQIGGPTGAFVVIVAGVSAAHGHAGLIVTTLLAGFILIAAGYAGIGRLVRSLLKMDAGERALLLLTCGLTVLVDLTVAIGVGVTLASLLFLARRSETAGLLPAELSIDDPAQRAGLPKGVEVFRFGGPMFFGVAREQAHREGTRLILCDLREQPAAFLARLGPQYLGGAQQVATFQAALDQVSTAI